MPFYTWLAGQLFKVTGPAFWPLRLLSLLATLVTAVLLATITHKESGDKWLAFIAAGLFLAGYRLAGGWYDLARVDALFVFLSLAEVMMVVYKAASRRWRLWLLLGIFAMVTAVPLIILQKASRGWFAYYMVSVAFANPWSTWGRLVIGVIILVGFIVLGLFWWGNGWNWLRQRPWLLFMATAVFMTISSLAPVGGNLNNVIPGYAFICLLPALLVKELPVGMGKNLCPQI